MDRCQVVVADTGDKHVDICNTYLYDGECPEHPAKKPGERAGTIDITPSWLAVVGLYLELLDELPKGYGHTDPKRQEMKAEILRAAKLADLYVKEHKR